MSRKLHYMLPNVTVGLFENNVLACGPVVTYEDDEIVKTEVVSDEED